MQNKEANEQNDDQAPKGQVVTPDNQEDPARAEQKKRGQLPLHDEEIGGA